MNKRLSWLVVMLWTAVILLVGVWHYWEEQKKTLTAARIQGLETFENDLRICRWTSFQEGVYIPITADNPPNPYLSHVKNRDITTTSGIDLTLIDPMTMTYQQQELIRQQTGRLGHITSLNPLRPENKPDSWETAALHSFGRGKNEVIEFTLIGDSEYLRLMRPLYAEVSCLKCHADMGYAAGDLLGGISASIPMAPQWRSMQRHVATMTVVYFLVWLLGLGGIALITSRNRRRHLERERAAEVLRLEKERAQQYLDVAAVIFVVLDTSCRITLINRRGLELLGYEESDLIGRDWFETCLPVRLQQQVKAAFEQMIAGEITLVDINVNSVLTREGVERIVGWHNTLLRDADGNISGILSSVKISPNRSGRRRSGSG